MGRAVSLLRGINVGGHRKVPMADLAQLYGELGFADVKTYIQSGNVVFDDCGLAQDEAERRLDAGIEGRYGFKVGVMLRSAAEWGEVLARNPYLEGKGEDQDFARQLVVTFLSEPPSPERVDAAKDVDSGEDEFAVVGRDVYVNCVGGYGVTGLSNGFFEKQLGVRATTRNWRTVGRIAELL